MRIRRIVFVLLMFCWSTAYAEYAIKFTRPSSPEQMPLALDVRKSGALENLLLLINRTVTTPRQVPVIARSCGFPNAFYDSARREITLCYELLVDNERRLRKKLGNQYSDAQYQRILWSEVAFVLLHEMAHHLIHEYSIPVLGGEEDAADKIAAYIFLTSGGEQVLKSSLLFFASAPTNRLDLVLNGTARLSDEHGLNEQRLANVVCWGFGRDPHDFGPVAAAFKIPQTRLSRCRGEYEKMVRDVPNLLGSNLAAANIRSRSPASAGTAVSDADPLSVLKANQCTLCHDAELKLVGPSFKEIASRYGSDELVVALAKKVKLGSVGVWGAVPAPPMTTVDTKAILQLASWMSSYR